MKKYKIILIVHDVRSTHNVGSILRSADGLGIEHVYLTGYTPHPALADDKRLPHLKAKIDRQINKTALGAEKSVKWTHEEDIFSLLNKLAQEGFQLVALEQTNRAIPIEKLKIEYDIALVVGSEVKGITKDVLDKVDTHIQIPMKGTKESFNVAVAAAIAVYHLRSLS